MKNLNVHTACMLLLLALYGGGISAQGLMRGDTSPGGEGPAMEEEHFTVGDDVAAAHLGTGAEAGTGRVMDAGFGEAVDPAAVTEMSETELAIAVVKLSRQNQQLKAAVSEGEAMRGEIKRLENEIELLQGGWEPVQE